MVLGLPSIAKYLHAFILSMNEVFPAYFAAIVAASALSFAFSLLELALSALLYKSLIASKSSEDIPKKPVA